jgi:hypothetical protein
MRPAVVTIVSGMLALSFFSVAAALDSVPPAPADQRLPLYKPPKDSKPGGRVSSITRGKHDDAPVVLALAPDHVGLSKQVQPVLYWYLSKPTTYRIEFTLVDSRAIAPMIETVLTPPHEAGIHAIRLADYGISLEPGVTYRWFVSVIRDPNASSRDVVAGAVLEHVTLVEALYLTEAAQGDEVHRYAEAGLWYDAIRTISELIRKNPAERILKLQRASLLEQVGLKPVAEYDARQ